MQAVFSHQWLLLARENQHPKIIIIFSLDKFYSLKAHANYFTILIYFAAWKAAKLGIFFIHFMFTNLPWCSQSINSLIYVYILYTDPWLLFMSAWSQSWSHFFILTLSKKIFLYYPLTTNFPFFQKTIPQKIECCFYIMHMEFSGSFLTILLLFSNLKLMIVFYSWNVFSLQVGDTSWKQSTLWLWLLLQFIYFLSCVIFDKQLKITFRKSSASAE